VASALIVAPAPESAPWPNAEDMRATTVAERVREDIAIASALAPRSQQVRIGPSELGMSCDRALAHRIAGTVPSGQSKSDPLAPLVGTGVHLGLAECFRRLDGRSGRFLVEHPVTYRGITGNVDLYDRRHRTAVDWKSTTKAKIKRIAHDGPPSRYLVQGMTYGAGLIAAGELVDYVAIVYVPVDGLLADIHAVVRPFDRATADTAIDRYESVARDTATHGPAALPAHTSALCGWCDWYRPGHPADAHGCPGQSGENPTEQEGMSNG
jgi:hypothetical protein